MITKKIYCVNRMYKAINHYNKTEAELCPHPTGIFRVVDFLKKRIRPVAISVVILIILLLWCMPVIFGAMLVVTVLIFLLGIFNTRAIQRSLVKLCIFLFLLGIISSPILYAFINEKNSINHPEILIDCNNPKILEMTEEFWLNYALSHGNTKTVLEQLENYIYEKTSYYWLPFLPFPTTKDVVLKKNSDCRGRAIIGYAILKNLDYDVDIVYSFGGHAWVRVYEGESYLEALQLSGIYKPWVIFNEDKVTWEAALPQISHIIFQGLYMIEYIPDIFPSPSLLLDSIRNIRNISGINLIDFATPLPFAIPVCASTLFVLLMSNERKLRKYILMIFLGVVVVSISGSIGVITSRMVMPLPIIIVSGIYLRVLNWKFLSKNATLNGKCN